jgi:hypothetical protein
MTDLSRRGALMRGALALAFMTPALAVAQQKPAVSLFKIVTVKDEIVVGFDAAELSKLGGNDAGALARALKSAGTLSVWQYAVKHGPNGELQQAPLRKIGLMANDSLRVEPMSSPLAVLAHE